MADNFPLSSRPCGARIAADAKAAYVFIAGLYESKISPLKNSRPGYAIMSSPPAHNPLLNMQLGYALLRDRRVPIRTKLIALGIGAAAIGAIELLQLPVEGVLCRTAALHWRRRRSRPGQRGGRHRPRADSHHSAAPYRARRYRPANPRRTRTGFLKGEGIDGRAGRLSGAPAVPFLKSYIVFNAEQIAGLPEHYRPEKLSTK
jgi:hypothetical protein